MVYRAGNEDPEFRKKAKDWQAKKADAGYAGITWSKDWGGRGGTPIQQVIYDQEEAKYAVPARPLRHRARHVHPDDLHLGHAGAPRALCQEGAARGGGMVPALLRAGRGLRPRRPAHARGARRRGLGRQRPEDLDLGRALLRLRRAGDAQRLLGAEAQGPHLLLHRHEVAGHRDPARSSRSPASRTSTRCSSPTCASPTASAWARSATAGRSR
jgi:hypothetical protein